MSRLSMRVSYQILPPVSSPCHCFGVNSLAYNSDAELLYSAGRDSSIRCWDVSGGGQVSPFCLLNHRLQSNDPTGDHLFRTLDTFKRLNITRTGLTILHFAITIEYVG